MIPIHLLALALMPLQADAQGQSPEAKPTTLQVQKAPPLRTAEDLIGSAVQNGQGKTLGQVHEILLHPRGDVAFVVLTTAGWLDVGQRMVPVPWEAFEFRPEEGLVELPVVADHFKKAPNYGADQGPKLNDMEWFAGANEHFKTQKKLAGGAAVEASAFMPAKRFHPVSTLKTRNVENPQGEQLGKIHALVLDQQAGRVAFAVVAVGGHLGTNEKLVAVPWSAIEVAPDTNNPTIDRLTMATTAERLAQAPEFRATKDKSEPLADPAWLLTVYEFHAVQPYWTTTIGKETDGKQD